MESMQVYAIIKPNSKHDESVLVGEGGTLVVRVKEPDIDGRANKAAIKLIATHFGVPVSRVSLVRGRAAKYKVFEAARKY